MIRTRHMSAAIAGASALAMPTACTSPLDGPDVRLDTKTAEVERDLARQWRDDSIDLLAAGADGPDRAIDADSVPALGADSDLRDYVVHAALNSPQLEAAFARWKAALERMPQVRALPDPNFSYGYFINEVETRVGPQQHRVMVRQMFPWFGTLELREGVAGKQAEAAYDRYLAERLEVIHTVRDAWYDRAGLDGEINITRENIDLLTQLERTALDRYRVGATAQADVIRLQIERERLQDRLDTLEDRRRPIDARLNAALNRPTGTPVEGAFSLPIESLDADDDDIAGALRDHNPRLRAIERQIESGRLATKLAKNAGYPDFTLGLDYIATGEAINPDINESGDDPLIASVSINLPIWREKYEAGVREAVAERYANIRSRRDLENDLTSSIQQALFDYRTAERKIVLYRDALLPKAQQTLEATLGAYSSGAATFLDLLEAQRDLLDFEIMHIRALTSRARQLARLDQLVGTDLPRKTDREGDEP